MSVIEVSYLPEENSVVVYTYTSVELVRRAVSYRVCVSDCSVIDATATNEENKCYLNTTVAKQAFSDLSLSNDERKKFTMNMNV